MRLVSNWVLPGEKSGFLEYVIDMLNHRYFSKNLGEVSGPGEVTTMYGIMTLVHGPKTIFNTGWSNRMKTKFNHS